MGANRCVLLSCARVTVGWVSHACRGRSIGWSRRCGVPKSGRRVGGVGTDGASRHLCSVRLRVVDTVSTTLPRIS
eukprot:4903527-Prymnesium_polylepis.1